MMVTRLAWIAHKFVSSNKPTKYASDASWSAKTAVDWNRKSVLKSCAISRTRRWNGSLRIKSSVDFWYLLRESYECSPVSPPRRPNLASRASGLKPYLSSVATHRISRSATVPGR